MLCRGLHLKKERNGPTNVIPIKLGPYAKLKAASNHLQIMSHLYFAHLVAACQRREFRGFNNEPILISKLFISLYK